MIRGTWRRSIALGGLLLAGCGGQAAPAPVPVPGQRGGASCHEVQPLVAPTEGATVPGYDVALACADTCVLALAHGATRQRHDLEARADHSEVAVARADLDGDGHDELVVDAALVDEIGPNGEMELVEHTLVVLDAATLEIRWSASSWASEPPEPQSRACASEAVLLDQDCDGRRETLVQTRRCDAPMCADVRAGSAEVDDHVRAECSATTPSEEQGRFRAAHPGVVFAAT